MATIGTKITLNYRPKKWAKCSILQANFARYYRHVLRKSRLSGGWGGGFLAPLGTKITLDYRPKKLGEMLDITGAFCSILNHILR